MTYSQLVKRISKLEGKKHQCSVGDVRELLAIISEMMFLEPEVLDALLKLGHRRSKVKGKAK